MVKIVSAFLKALMQNAIVYFFGKAKAREEAEKEVNKEVRKAKKVANKVRFDTDYRNRIRRLFKRK